MRAATLDTDGRLIASPKMQLSARVGVREIALAGIVCLAAGLRFASLRGVPNNFFYDAAVRSMGQSWHNFFFAAFEPGGRVAIDKPPVDLWLQVASVKVFGFNSYALKLPAAVAGTAAVALIYDLVRRLFGTGAGLVSALALAVLPIAVLTSRSDTMDTFMMALMVLAAWLVVRALETGSASYLFAGAAVLGIDFNVKLFEALLPVPALAALYLLGARMPARIQLKRAAAAALIFTTVALSWPLAASIAPAGHKPYPLGSTNGSVWNSIFDFNGLDRLAGTRSTGDRGEPPHSRFPPSADRLFSRSTVALDKRVGAELFPAMVLGLLAVAASALAFHHRTAQSRDRRKYAGAVAFALWLAVGVIGFSAMGRLHVRYLEAFSPAIAATLGAAVMTLARASSERRRAAACLLVALVPCAAYALHLAQHEQALRALILSSATLASLSLLAILVVPRFRNVVRNHDWQVGAVAILTLLPLLAVPTSESLAIVRHHESDSRSTFSHVSPHQAARLSRYLIAHQGKARYEVATRNPWQASLLIVPDGRPVLVMRNVNAHALVSISELSASVRAGRLKYVLLGQLCSLAKASPACQPLARWVRKHGTRVEQVGKRVGLWHVRVPAPL